MEDLTPEQIGQMFRDLGLEGEEERDSFRQLGSEPEVATKPTRQFFIRIVSRDGRILGKKLAGIDPSAFFTEGNLSRLFPEISPREFVDVEIDTQSDDLRVWAFISATDYDLHRIKLYLPE